MSYRREDSAGYAGRLCEHLSGVLGTPPPDPSSSPDSQNVSFADALASAQNNANTAMPTSTGTNRAGVDSVQWARDFLTRLNMPVTADNVRDRKSTRLNSSH